MHNTKGTIYRMHKLMSIMTLEYLADLEKAEEERKACEEAEKNNDPVVMVLTGETNARMTLEYMKEIRKCINFMNDEKNEVEDWQLAGINAMFDQVNEDKFVPFDLAYAISGILGIVFD